MKKQNKTETSAEAQELTRRNFLTEMVAAAGGLTLLSEGFAAQAAEIPHAEVAEKLAQWDDEGNILERMRAELLRALQKPLAERKWIMVIDLQKCVAHPIHP